MNLAIVDDERDCQNTLITYLKDLGYEHNLVGVASSVEEGTKLVQEQRIDVLLLDLELEDGLGFEILKKVPEFEGVVIFTTAHAQYAIDAFQFSAVDYLLKPIALDAFELALSKAKEQLKLNVRVEQLKLQYELLSQMLSNQTRAPQRIALRKFDEIEFVETEDIIHIQSDSNYSVVYLTDNRKVVISKPLKEMDKLLGKLNFYRVHHSHLINLRHVVKYLKTDGGGVVMSDDSTVSVSRTRKDDFMTVLENFVEG